MKAILACDACGGIGKNNQLPWTSLDNDLQRFKTLTQNATVVMGHKTWASLPKKPLPNRRNIVVSRSISSVVGADIVSNISDITYLTNAWFIGGAELLNHIWAHIDEFHLTRANALFDCDTYIDLVYLEQNFIQTQYQIFKDNTYEVWVKNETIS